MFIFLSKFLPLFVYPVGLLCILLILVLLIRKNQSLQKLLIIITLLIIIISGNKIVAFSLVRSLEWQYLPPANVPDDVIAVVLGGATDSALYPRTNVEVNGAADRVIYAGRLYQDGKIEKILLSGGYIDWMGSGPNSPAEEMADILNLMGVPDEDLILETKSLNTYENALYCSQILKEMNIEKILLITSASHMPRSVALFEKQGMEVVPLPTDYGVTEAIWQDLFNSSVEAQMINLVPTVGNISSTTGALKEYIGILVYKFNGWL